jgi:LysM repeat protein
MTKSFIEEVQAMKRRVIAVIVTLLVVLVLASSVAVPTSAQGNVNYVAYISQPGDTLAKLAREFCTTWQEIYELNQAAIGPDPNVLAPETHLVLPDRCGPPSGGSNGVYDRGPRLGANGVVVGNVYTVAWGDTLYSISLRFGVPMSELMRLNGLTSEKIHFGQKLIIPGLAQALPSPPYKDFASGECILNPFADVPLYDYPDGSVVGQTVAGGAWPAIRGVRTSSGQTWYMIDTEPGSGNPPLWVRDRDTTKTGNCSW